MIQVLDDHVQVSGSMTLDVATALLEEGKAAVAHGNAVVDLSQVGVVDSSALAVIFGWMREAAQNGHQLTVSQPPAQLMSLAKLYGVAELLPLA